MRHIAKIITATILGASLAACGGGGSAPSGTATSTTTSSTGGNTARPFGVTASNVDAAISSPSVPGSTGSTGDTAAATPAGATTPTVPAFLYDESARFNNPTGIKSDLAGNLYVLDTGGGVGTVRKISATGAVSTLSMKFSGVPPGGMEVDTAGTVYIIHEGGTITSVTSAPSRDSYAYRIPGATQPTADGQGNLYVLVPDGPSPAIWRVPPGGIGAIRAISLSPGVIYQGLALDKAGNLYTMGRAAENPDGYGRLMRFAPNGTETDIVAFDFRVYPDDPSYAITTIANMTFDAAGNLYVAHYRQHVPSPGCGEFNTCGDGFYESGMSIDRISPARVTTRVRTGPPGSTGKLAEEHLYDRDYSMSFITVGIDGNLYATFRRNETVYRISQLGETTLIAGKPGEAGTSD